MNSTENLPALRPSAVLAWGLAFGLGVALLFLLRWAERALATTLLGSSLLEEASKVFLFLALALALRLGQGRLPGASDPELLPLVSVVGFALMENALYFIHTPVSSVYQRLLYAYPVHLNTGLLYTAVFLSFQAGRCAVKPARITARPAGAPARAGATALAARALLALLAVLAGTAYHFLLNVLALSASGIVTYGIGGANLVILLLLFFKIHGQRLERSLIHAGL